ncbi:MAG: DUF192 domain-containing protein [Parcubacteria group bacterium]|nr:DUF192 domain-containing protein [Parcubacteria group bacterium]
MNKVVVSALLFLIFIVGFVWVFNSNSGFLPYTTHDIYLPVIFIEGTPFKVEVAKTPEARRIGLSNRGALEFGRGMLFPFSTNDTHGIWMREMLFPIDIIWLNEDLEVVDIKRDARVESYPEVFRPKIPAKYVLELSATSAEIYNIKIGDKATFTAL